MGAHLKEIVGSYLTEQEAMDKINWLKDEGFRSEEIFLIRSTSGELEPLNEESSPAEADEELMNTPSPNIDPLKNPGSMDNSFGVSGIDGVAATLINMGFLKEEAYRYEYDVKVGKVLILTDIISAEPALESEHMETFRSQEDLSLTLEDDPADIAPTSNSSRPFTDANIDSNKPLDEWIEEDSLNIQEEAALNFVEEDDLTPEDAKPFLVPKGHK
ncbi:general stress protein [Sutcliffiella deserti]|uniref:general stress protein n=1 Tax=Sutcliffiella deserti TaxID=2875501 RepID=UPI001CC1ABE3|nr:general stress protein [Sutcliffiella deserti]